MDTNIKEINADRFEKMYDCLPPIYIDPKSIKSHKDIISAFAISEPYTHTKNTVVLSVFWQVKLEIGIAYFEQLMEVYTPDKKGINDTYGHYYGKGYIVNDITIIPIVETPAPVTVNFFLEGAREIWDAIEVHPVGEEDGTPYIIDNAGHPEVKYWSVYLHTSAGIDCIADLPTEKLANAFADVLESAAKRYRTKAAENTIQIIWSIDDIVMRALDRKKKVEDATAREILMQVKQDHDAGVGINWQIIDLVTDLHTLTNG